MELVKYISVTCTEGDFRIVMGKCLTTLYYKGQEKFVFRNSELDIIFEMVKAAKEKLNEKDTAPSNLNSMPEQAMEEALGWHGQG